MFPSLQTIGNGVRRLVAENIKQRLAEHLDHLRIQIDDRDNLRPGDKFFHWIQQGVPVKVEIGPRDVKQQSAMVARRDVRDKKLVPLDEIADHVMSLLQQIQRDLYQRALDFREANTRTAKVTELKKFSSKKVDLFGHTGMARERLKI